jgi:S-adenosylmethionine decarboxylase
LAAAGHVAKGTEVNGVEWMVDVHGCRPERLQQRDTVLALFERIVARVRLRPVGPPLCHQFPGTNGLTAVWMLQESHLTIHTFPEFGSASLNLFCCTARPAPDWVELVRDPLEGTGLRVQEIARVYAPAEDRLS